MFQEAESWVTSYNDGSEMERRVVCVLGRHSLILTMLIGDIYHWGTTFRGKPVIVLIDEEEGKIHIESK